MPLTQGRGYRKQASHSRCMGAVADALIIHRYYVYPIVTVDTYDKLYFVITLPCFKVM
jgi:hypothetical protein